MELLILVALLVFFALVFVAVRAAWRLLVRR